MIFPQKTITLKDGRQATFRSPSAKDAPEMMACLKRLAGETDFILRYPEECTESAEQEEKYLRGINASDTGLMIVATVDGEMAGNCQLTGSRRLKLRHRGSIGIGLLEKYWGLGIGTAMLDELIALGRKWGLYQLELDFVEGNTRAQALYEKMGFVIVAQRPDAIRLKDGTMLKEYSMVKRL